MTENTVKGSCLCGEVCYQVEGPFKIFQYCHCSRCRKFTGSLCASNLFVPPERFEWTQGKELVGRYEHNEAKFFATNFCKQCGSSLPWEVQGGKNIIVTAGTLDDDPGIKPMWNIFWKFKAPWLEDIFNLPKHDEFPKKQ
jgi:hypothetical protein